METADVFVLGVIMLIFWSAVILLFARPNLFKNLIQRFICCRKTLDEDTLEPGAGAISDVETACHPTDYTVPSSRSNSVRRSSSLRTSSLTAKHSFSATSPNTGHRPSKSRQLKSSSFRSVSVDQSAAPILPIIGPPSAAGILMATTTATTDPNNIQQQQQQQQQFYVATNNSQTPLYYICDPSELQAQLDEITRLQAIQAQRQRFTGSSERDPNMIPLTEESEPELTPMAGHSGDNDSSLASGSRKGSRDSGIQNTR